MRTLSCQCFHLRGVDLRDPDLLVSDAEFRHESVPDPMTGDQNIIRSFERLYDDAVSQRLLHPVLSAVEDRGIAAE